MIKSLIAIILIISFLSLGVRFIYSDIIVGSKLKPQTQELSIALDVKKANNWNTEKLKEISAYMDSVGTTSLIIFHKGELIAEWGETEIVSSVHSIRKSIVSALYGIGVEKGFININKTLEELGFDDHNPFLSKKEKQATLKDLLTARSGIYHPSIKDDNGPLPERGSHQPNTHFHYNNWSFNAAGIIFEKLTNLSLGEAFENWIAIPTQMDDFNIEDVHYTTGEESVFPAFRFYMSGRDLARFALLYRNNGKWKEKEIIPSSWIKETFIRYTGNENEVSYGYMWWILPNEIYMATGTGGQKIWIDAKNDIVLVNRVNTGKGFTRFIWTNWGARVNNGHMRKLNQMIVKAIP